MVNFSREIINEIFVRIIHAICIFVRIKCRLSIFLSGLALKIIALFIRMRWISSTFFVRFGFPLTKPEIRLTLRTAIIFSFFEFLWTFPPAQSLDMSQKNHLLKKLPVQAKCLITKENSSSFKKLWINYLSLKILSLCKQRCAVKN